MAYEVKRITTGRLLNDFIKLPFLIYKNDPSWVAPMITEVKRVLDPNKNPYFKKASLELFNCYKDQRICSRIAIVINPMHQKKIGEKNAFFGFFESLNDTDAVSYLFQEVEKYSKIHDVELLEGPFNPTHYSELGLQLNKFGSVSSFFQTYNPPYYCHLLEDVGFQICKTIHTRKNENIQEYLKQNFKNVNQVEAHGFNIRSFRFNDLNTDLEHLRAVFNDAFSDNWHFLPLSREEYLFSSKYLNLVTTPDLIQFVEYYGQPVGAVHFVMDINPLLKKFKGRSSPWYYLKFQLQKKKIGKLIIFAVGIRKDFRHTKAFSLISNIIAKIARNYQVLETTWTSYDNTAAIRAAKYFGLEADKEFGIYRKELN